ncbi:hypothetical protein H1R20_g12681, partial [Candolleomyces eurysporus]
MLLSHPPLRNEPTSSNGQLDAPVFSPDPQRPHSKPPLGCVHLPATTATQWGDTADPTWTDGALIPPGNWGLDDVSMSGVQSEVPSCESTTAPSNAPRASESTHGVATQRAWGAAGDTLADVAEALSTVAQWFNTFALSLEDDMQAWNSV